MLKLLVGLLVLSVAIWQMRRFNKVLKDPVSDDLCVACNSNNLKALGPNAYLCNACGYEGGSGLAAIREAERAKKLAAMSTDQRHASGLNDLREARTLLLGCQGIMANTVSLSRGDMLGSGDSGREKQQQLANAVNEMMLAAKLVDAARQKLGDALEESDKKAFEIDFSDTTSFLDVTGDNLAFDLAMHSRIKAAAKHAEAMLVGVDNALSRLSQARG